MLVQAAQHISAGEVVYCLVRDKNRGARNRLDEIALAHGVPHDRCVMVPGILDAEGFGLEDGARNKLAASVGKVIHCAAMVNLSIGRKEMLDWSAPRICTVLQYFCDADADLRLSSSSAVFPGPGGPWPEAPASTRADIKGDGAAKTAADEAIRTAGILAVIARKGPLRLVSLCSFQYYLDDQ